MSINHSRRGLAVIVAGLMAGVPAAGCSKDSTPSPKIETASSPAAPAVSLDSAAGAVATETVPSPAEPAGARPRPVAKPPVKPRRADTRPAAPAVDSAPTSAVPSAKTPTATDAAVAADTARATAATDSAPSQAAVAAPPARGGQDDYLEYDPGTNTVTFELIGGPRGFEFNGYSNGGATLTLPPKANVVINFINKDGTPHSAAVISGEGPIPNAGGEPAIPRAYTNQLLQGLPQEGSDVMRFQVPESGTYRIFCGVPGHGLSGMWIWMKVDPTAKQPSFGPTKS